MQHQAYIALGSNLDQPLQQVMQALRELDELPGSCLLVASPWYRSAPFGPVEQPDFINGVALLQTSLTPPQLLQQMQAIEKRHLRQRRIRWGPRTLDLDLLLYDDRVLNKPQLKVPHPGMRERNFVLYPLADINPELTLPTGESLASLLSGCPATGLSRLPDSTGARRG